MNDNFLNDFRKEPRADFAAALHQRISDPMQTGLRRSTWRYAAASVAAFAVLALSIFLSPSAFAFAQGIVHQVGAYVFVLNAQPIELPHTRGPLQIWRSPNSVSLRAEGYVPSTDDPHQASAMARFAVLSPSYLPEGYHAMTGWYVYPQDGGMVVSRGFSAQPNHFLNVSEWKMVNATQRYERTSIVSVTVRGHPGVWLPDTINGANGKNALVWEENGITYWITTDAVPLDQLLKVAEGLGR